MRRWMPAGLVVAATACGARQIAPPTTTPEPDPVVIASQPAAPTLPDTAPAISSQFQIFAPAYDTTRLASAVDSATDAAVLDTLAKAEPAATLPDIPIDAHVTWDLNVADFADQPRVKYYLDFFTGREHDRFQTWLDRMARYEGYARAEFATHKLPGDFVYLGLIESGFSPEAVSRTYAVGMWQFMLGTGKLYGLRTDSWVDERRDPIKSTDAAARDLDDLTQRFGSHYLAAAAYNAGAGRVGRGLDLMGGGSDSDSVDVTSDGAFFSLADTRMIRDETKNYVPQLIAAAIVAKEPAKYGFEPARDVAPFPRDSVLVDGGTGLDLIAKLADTTLDALRDLNPHLLRLVTPPDGPYPVRVPAGSAERIEDAYAALPDSERHAIVPHQMKSGETVATVARRYHVAAETIRSVNRVARARYVAPGTTLYIPAATTLSAADLREPDPPRTIRTVTRTVVVRRGESIASVARRAGVSVARLRSENQLGDHAGVHAGERLITRRTTIVSGGRTVAAASGRRVAPQPGAELHVVQRGETVGGIAQQYGIRQSTLIALNGLARGSALRTGQTLRIPPRG
ncbi:MAG TPA: LysM peptidoglycan-binding domain-containing protein [Gemmatimonadales bacterium]